MKNYGGDLADIIRTGGIINGSIPDITDQYDQDYEHNKPILRLEEEDPLDEFGDPFSLLLQDPLTTTVDDGVIGCSSFFSNAAVVLSNSGIGNIQSGFNGEDHQSVILAPKIDDQEELIRRPSINFFTRMLQISPMTTKLSDSAPVRDSAAVGASVKITTPTMLSNSKGENLQISSPRNAGIKRRKSQARKVVCIPAPAPVNSRSSGEVVPSDLWAWRKYGQKPIKGSPYPRGYYRCSSSKGCPARKQVERSRSDPNMLVITYTCEHNHQWPTQRNALAGSTRNTDPATKSGSKYSKTSSSSQSHKPHRTTTTTTTTVLFKEEQMEEITNIHESQPSLVKDEIMEDYKPGIFTELSNHAEDHFFAELGELESDPMNILFPLGYSEELDDGENKSLDPFTFYDWAGNSSISNLLRDDLKGSSEQGFNK